MQLQIFICIILIINCIKGDFIDEKVEKHNPILQLLEEFTRENPQIFDQINALIEYSNLDPFGYNKKVNYDPLKCTACKVAAKQLNQWEVEELKITDAIVTFATNVCTSFGVYDYEVCDGIIGSQGPVWFHSFWIHYTDPDFLCPALQLCTPVYEKIDIDALIQDILKDKPKKEQLVPKQENTIKFMQMADIHTDFDYDENASKTCRAMSCCRKDTGAATSEEDKSGYWGTIASCDIPERTFNQFVNFVKNRVEDLQFVLWTGDNTSHNLWNQTPEQNVQNTITQTQYIKDNFKDAPVIPIFGNHEEYPANLYKFYKPGEQDFRDVFVNIWENWIGKEAAQNLSTDGYYELELYDKKLKVIVMNTQACYEENVALVANPTDPGAMLQNLRKSLQQSEDNDQAVYIMSHIPSNRDCLKIWSDVYNALVDRYSYTIRGIFAGHSHADELEIFYSVESGEAINATFIAPSLTTYHSRNSSFRVFEIDADTYQILNYYQYRLDVDYWNQFTDPNTELLWEVAYDFLSEYEIPNMYEYENINTVRQNVGSDLKTYNTYMSNYYAGVWTDEDQINIRKYCRMLSTKEQQAKCLDIPFYPDLNQFLAGPWVQKKK